MASLDRPSIAALSRILGSTERVPSVAMPPDTPLPVRGDTPGSVKGVPYYEAGRVIGFRVTGVRPGSWARDFGLQEGDVIEAIDERTLTGDADANALLRNDFAPSSLRVRRVVDRVEQRLRVGQS